MALLFRTCSKWTDLLWYLLNAGQITSAYLEGAVFMSMAMKSGCSSGLFIKASSSSGRVPFVSSFTKYPSSFAFRIMSGVYGLSRLCNGGTRWQNDWGQ